MRMLLLPASQGWEEGQMRSYTIRGFEKHKAVYRCMVSFWWSQKSCLPEMHQAIPKCTEPCVQISVVGMSAKGFAKLPLWCSHYTPSPWFNPARMEKIQGSLQRVSLHKGPSQRPMASCRAFRSTLISLKWEWGGKDTDVLLVTASVS